MIDAVIEVINVAYGNEWTEVIQGTWNGSGCNPSNGICEVIVHAGGGYAVPTGGTYPAGHMAGVWTKDASGDLHLFIEKNTLHPSTLSTYSGGFMNIPSGARMPDNLAIFMGYSIPHYFTAGSYPVVTVTDPSSGEQFLHIAF